MREENIYYPIEDLQTIATAQGKLLSGTWQGHQTHLKQQILQPASQLTGGVGDTFQQHMTIWSQHLGKCYRALMAFTSLLNAGATTMETVDKNLGQTFTPHS